MQRRYRLLLKQPDRMMRNLRALHRIGQIDEVPTPFQIFMGICYMRYRVTFRSETVGKSDQPVRSTLRARLFKHRPLRFPFLVRERVIQPSDLTGFSADHAYLKRHVLGAHHDGDDAAYDLSLLTIAPELLTELRDEVAAIVDGSHPRAEFWKDLVVFEGYHEHLLGLIDRALANDFTNTGPSKETDSTLRGYVRWCCSQPEGPMEAWRALTRGELSLAPA